MRHGLVVRFAIDGDLRFISHHDTLRLFERALARADWPVKFSGGFNPRPRLSLPLPRSVGVASDDELLVVDLERPLDPREAMNTLNEQLPAGIRVRNVRLDAGGALQPTRVCYETCLPGTGPELDQAIHAFLQRDACVVRREATNSRAARDVDIRPYVEDLSRREDRLSMTLLVTPRGTVRPAEVLDALGLPGREWLHRTRRTRVQWAPDESTGRNAAPPADA